MPKFRTCNHYYLRLSETDILPLYVSISLRVKGEKKTEFSVGVPRRATRRLHV